MKVNIDLYQKSINSTKFTALQIATIWEFYVTKSIANSASQKRTLADYHIKSLPINDMKRIAGIADNNYRVLLANSINKTLQKHGLIGENNQLIEIDTPKIVCSTPFTIADNNPPKARYGEAESILTHLRNAFAHGLTFFFDNGNVLFEDKDNRGMITARIILQQKTLLDWIYIIDINGIFYKKDM